MSEHTLPECPGCGFRVPRRAQLRSERVPGHMKLRYVPRMCCVECGYYNKKDKVAEADVKALLAGWPKREKEKPGVVSAGQGEEVKQNDETSFYFGRRAGKRGFAARVIRGGRR